VVAGAAQGSPCGRLELRSELHAIRSEFQRSPAIEYGINADRGPAT
jgi:hypothetical protein